ncbi:hypothetical protein BLNAU_9274 [Blattamonas nauphoetae]|uniref:Uncharacterized protein n=1 Tax=Blattamonas nauphoetae TaxID=2049346 RepID=A0ABQ9XW85_9EUKA|nr:hypothetical protein BLNAU_9274 [Blattamonas nauphoetae]
MPTGPITFAAYELSPSAEPPDPNQNVHDVEYSQAGQSRGRGRELRGCVVSKLRKHVGKGLGQRQEERPSLCDGWKQTERDMGVAGNVGTNNSRADVRLSPTLSTTLDKHTDLGRNAARPRLIKYLTHLSSSALLVLHSSPFLNWKKGKREFEDKAAIIFRSLVATLKLMPSLDDNLEEKAVQFLTSVKPKRQEAADAFLTNIGQTIDDSLINFIQSIVVLISSASQNITTAAMKMLDDVLFYCSTTLHHALVKADLIPQLVTYLKPMSLSLTKAGNISRNLISCIRSSAWLATPGGLEDLEIEAPDEQQALHETVLQQVMAPSEKYICHLCVNRYSIVDRDLSVYFLELLAFLLEICPYYQPTMDFVLHMPVILTIPSCLTFIDTDYTIWYYLSSMVSTQREWNKTRGLERQTGKAVVRMLRMEGIDDELEEKLQNDKNRPYGRDVVDEAIRWNNLLGMNLPKQK